ncbi:MAG: hypothetical protein AAGF95_04205 [Chloroflexota bacterium]
MKTIITRSREPVGQSPAAQIRDALTKAEKQIVVMHDTPDGALETIRQVEHIEQQLARLAGLDIDTRGEESRAEALRERLIRESRKVARLIRKNGHADQLTASALWQTISETHQQNQRQQRNRLIAIGTSLFAIIIIFFVVLPSLFPPPPRANTDLISRAVQAGDTNEALAIAQAEQVQAPNDPNAALWIGGLLQLQGDQTGADTAWEEAQQLFNDDDFFHLERGMMLTQLQLYTEAEYDAQILIDDPETEPQGHYLQGHINEARGDIAEAIGAFNQAADIASARENSELFVAARTRVAFLSQRLLVPSTEEQ